ncbi:MAG: hypothetical protein HYY41_01655 [Chloroflexi bacterium]|nr:hypothetical protein [Chloroflexota bacterium]
MGEVGKCDKCDREFTEEGGHLHPGKAYVHKGKLICEECMVDMGISIDETNPWQTYINTRIDINRG